MFPVTHGAVASVDFIAFDGGGDGVIALDCGKNIKLARLVVISYKRMN